LVVQSGDDLRVHALLLQLLQEQKLGEEHRLQCHHLKWGQGDVDMALDTRCEASLRDSPQ
jgi:hypothetical protein